MFTQKQLQSLDPNYFDIIQATGYCIVLRNKCTGHYWAIGGNGYGSSVSIRHRHNLQSPWHLQSFYGKAHTLQGAIKSIRAHDNYQLCKEKDHRRQLSSREHFEGQ